MRQRAIEWLGRHARTFDLFPEYLRSIYRHWSDYLFETLLLSPIILWWMLGNPPMWIVALAFVAALIVASYYAWRADRLRLIPKLRFRDSGFAIHNATTSDPNERRKYLQILLECATDAPVEECRGFLLRIRTAWGDEWQDTEFDHALPLTWSFYDTSEPRTLYRGVDQRLNLLWFNNVYQVSLTTAPQSYSIKRLDFNNYLRFDIRITAKDSPPLDISLKLRRPLIGGIPGGMPWDNLSVEQL
jgi:hypothetical protein